MSHVVERAGGARAAIGAGFAGLIALAGIGVAVTLGSCEVSSRAARRESPKQSVARAELPRMDAGVEHRSQSAGAPTPVSAMGMAAALPTSEPQMRVRILSSADTIRLTCAGGVTIGQGEPKGATTLSPGAKTEQHAGVSIALRGGQWLVSDIGAPPAPGAKPLVHTFAANLSIVILPAAGQMLSVNGTQYPGVIRLSSRTDVRADSFDAVDFVGIEDYLPGVVGKEMLTGWPLGAYQAQAVAARTYAMHERQRCAGAPYDVESNDRDQVYGGASTNATAREAVRSTRGVVLLDGDRLLRAYYSSTCGGRTAAARETWPTGPGFEFNLAAPIQEHHRDFACQQSPLFRWTVERPRAELAQRLKWYGERNGHTVKRIKDLRSIDVALLNSDGRPSRYRIADSSGASFMLSAEEMRLACNTNANGSLITLLPPSTPSVVAPLVQVTALPTEMPILGFGGVVGGGSTGTPMALAPAAATVIPDIDRRTRVHSSDFEVAVRGDRVTITGRGFGHGVGLCQYCAKGFADRGEDWRTMIERFYPGARITTMY